LSGSWPAGGGVPSIAACACSYDSLAALRIRPRTKRWLVLRPFLSNTIRTARVARFSPSRSEHRPFDRVSGSIGSTRSGK
jgi:hypothetical protein